MRQNDVIDAHESIKSETILAALSALTLLSRGVAHVIDQGLALVLFYWAGSLPVAVTR